MEIKMEEEWRIFLDCIAIEERLTNVLREVLMLIPAPGQQFHGGLDDYIFQILRQHDPTLVTNVFSNTRNRLINGLSFHVQGNNRLVELRRILIQKFQERRDRAAFFSNVGLTNIYDEFPLSKFQEEVRNLVDLSENQNFQYQPDRGIDILQTFAPNLSDLQALLTISIQRQIRVRILLAWPYSKIVMAREQALTTYSPVELHRSPSFNISSEGIRNLELLESILISLDENNHNFELKLYDTIPSMSIYKVNNYALVGFFLPNQLAIESFQLELNLNSSFMSDDITSNFSTTWDMGIEFLPQLRNPNWRNDLRVLFKNGSIDGHCCSGCQEPNISLTHHFCPFCGTSYQAS
jgi:hypothetical protein